MSNQILHPPPLLEQIPRPEDVVRRLGETITERRILRALLKAAKLKAQTTLPTSSLVDERKMVAGA